MSFSRLSFSNKKLKLSRSDFVFHSIYNFLRINFRFQGFPLVKPPLTSIISFQFSFGCRAWQNYNPTNAAFFSAYNRWILRFPLYWLRLSAWDVKGNWVGYLSTQNAFFSSWNSSNLAKEARKGFCFWVGGKFFD